MEKQCGRESVSQSPLKDIVFSILPDQDLPIDLRPKLAFPFFLSVRPRLFQLLSNPSISVDAIEGFAPKAPACNICVDLIRVARSRIVAAPAGYQLRYQRTTVWETLVAAIL